MDVDGGPAAEVFIYDADIAVAVGLNPEADEGIDVAEVEAAIYEHPAVKECAVVGKPDPSAGEIPKAYVVLKTGSSVSKEELVSFCAEKIAPYKRIREVEFIDEIPKTPVGKVLRRILRDREMKST